MGRKERQKKAGEAERLRNRKRDKTKRQRDRDRVRTERYSLTYFIMKIVTNVLLLDLRRETERKRETHRH